MLLCGLIKIVRYMSKSRNFSNIEPKKLRAVKCNNSFQDYIYNSPILKVSIG